MCYCQPLLCFMWVLFITMTEESYSRQTWSIWTTLQERIVWNLCWKEVVPTFDPMDASWHVPLSPMETECGPTVSIWSILKPYWPQWDLRIFPMCKRKKYSIGGFFVCLTCVHRDRATFSRNARVSEPSKWFRKTQCNVKTPFAYVVEGCLTSSLASKLTVLAMSAGIRP